MKKIIEIWFTLISSWNGKSSKSSGRCSWTSTSPLSAARDGRKQYTWSGKNSSQWVPPVGWGLTLLFIRTTYWLCPYGKYVCWVKMIIVIYLQFWQRGDTQQDWSRTHMRGFLHLKMLPSWNYNRIINFHIKLLRLPKVWEKGRGKKRWREPV